MENNTCKFPCNIPNCETCYSSTLCSKCKTGYEFNGVSCIFRCDISNCLICNDFNICIQCKNRYYLNLKGFCSECNIVHCKTCSINNNDKTCWECENDYKLENNECIQIKNSETKDDKSSNNKKLIIWLIITFIIILSLCILIIYLIYKIKINKLKQKNVNYRESKVTFGDDNNNNNKINTTAVGDNVNSDNIAKDKEINYNLNVINENNVTEKSKKVSYTPKRNNNLCIYCHRKQGIYKRNCGCFLCEEHFKPKEVIKNNDKILQCINCGFVILNEGQIKEECANIKK